MQNVTKRFYQTTVVLVLAALILGALASLSSLASALEGAQDGSPQPYGSDMSFECNYEDPNFASCIVIEKSAEQDEKYTAVILPN